MKHIAAFQEFKDEFDWRIKERAATRSALLDFYGADESDWSD